MYSETTDGSLEGNLTLKKEDNVLTGTATLRGNLLTIQNKEK